MHWIVRCIFHKLYCTPFPKIFPCLDATMKQHLVTYNILIAILIVFLGVVATIALADCNWLPRSGCILVAYGLLLSKWSLMQSTYIPKNHYNNPDLSSSRPVPTGTAETPTHHIFLDARQEFSASIDMKVSHYFAIVLIGTLIWGFGDMPLKFICSHTLACSADC